MIIPKVPRPISGVESF